MRPKSVELTHLGAATAVPQSWKGEGNTAMSTMRTAVIDMAWCTAKRT